MDSHRLLKIFQKNPEKVCRIKINAYLCIRVRGKHLSSDYWCGSSAWLERRPVTPEVEGSSPFRTAETVLMKIRAFFVVSRSCIVSFTRSEVILARDGKELPIGKTYLDNVLRAMTEGGS